MIYNDSYFAGPIHRTAGKDYVYNLDVWHRADVKARHEDDKWVKFGFVPVRENGEEKKISKSREIPNSGLELASIELRTYDRGRRRAEG